MSAETIFSLFAVAPPGLEVYTAGELAGLGLKPTSAPAHIQPGSGGVAFKANLEGLYRANLWLRTANRVLLRFSSFQATKFVELRRKVGNLDWEKFLQPGQAVALRVTCHQSRLYHSGAVAQRVAEGIGDRLGQLPALEKGSEDEVNAPMIVVRLVNNECTLSIDTSGMGLHRRGYRLASAKAPLRENLAAGILLASGWDGRSPLIDPFCGSGTIPIEAALLAMRIPPGLNRRFVFMDWPGYKPHLFNYLHQKAMEGKIDPPEPILGSDRDAGAVQMAVENAERAGVAAGIQFSRKAVSSILPPPGTGWLVSNPPYGVRVSPSKDLRDLYASFGKVLNEHFTGWNVAYLCSDEHLATLTHLTFEKGISLNNGGIPVKLTRATVP